MALTKQELQSSRNSVATTIRSCNTETSCVSTCQEPISGATSSSFDSERKAIPGPKQDLDLREHARDLEACKDEQDELPPSKRAAWLRYAVFSVYRRLFTLIFLGNLVGFISVLVSDQKLLNIVNAAVANLLALGLARQPLVVNLLFVVFGSVPRSAPFWLRRTCAKIYCYGGVHSGCGIASFTWYLAFIVLLTRQYITPSSSNAITITSAIVALSYIILVLLFGIIIAAYPSLRVKLHDSFELTHRFCGWAVVIFFWPLLVLFAIQAAEANASSLSRFLISFPTFWMVIVTTLAIVHPWTLLRRITVRPEPISSHAIRLHFTHTTVNFGQGLSVSKHPLRDWHSFATFPDKPSIGGTSGTVRSAPDFSCLISKAGDWTTDTIANPPQHLWKRAVPIYGFGYVMKVFHRIILVTTGSGIGPCLSYLGDPVRPAMRVIWQTRTPLQTYGQPIIDLVRQLDKEPHIIDTNSSGKRTDMLPLVIRLFKEFDAEAICVISNPIMTKKLVFDCESRGVPAFGPIFDS